MASGRMRGASQEYDIRQIIHEAHLRWLKPLEICEILSNFHKYGFQLNPVPPVKPPSGSLFLFDRKAVRYFRKDGHNWRKKKDGKTVREAHERLKAGSVDVLHCYYAHGEDDPSFQRRSYWMLDSAYENIVLVHYLQVHQGPRPSTYRPAGMGHMSPPIESNAPSPSIEHTASEPDDVDSSDDVEEIHVSPKQAGPSLFTQISSKDWSSILAESNFPQMPLPEMDDDFDDLLNAPDKYLGPKPLTPAVSVDNEGWNAMMQMLETSPSTSGVKQEVSWQQTFERCTTPGSRDALLGQASPMKLEAHELPSPARPTAEAIREILSPKGLGRKPLTPLEAQLRAATEENALRAAFAQPQAAQKTSAVPSGGVPTRQLGAQQTSPTNMPWQQQQYALPQVAQNVLISTRSPGDNFKKMDSFGRWVTQQLGDDSPGALLGPLASDSGSYWMFDETSTAETPGMSAQMQYDVNVSIAHVQRFTITDFSPNWAFANDDATVLVSGRFLDPVVNPQEFNWCCMFGDIEVPAEVINPGVFRCKVPARAPGRLPFYITCSDRLACSEVREFEIRAKQEKVPALDRTVRESVLQVRLAKMLLSDAIEPNDEGWKAVENGVKSGGLSTLATKDKLLELFFEDSLRRFLSTKERATLFDDHGQGLLHLASALDFDWAIKSLLEAGVVPNFRDSRGWTALHWAATFGREKTVVALLAAGTSPSLVTDPTSKHPNGQMASDLASDKGIAGFLAEKALTSHLSSLTIADNGLNEITSVSASLEGDNAAGFYAAGGEVQDDALSAVRNATKAAALIHSAYRIDSFRKKKEEEGEGEPDEYGLSPAEIQALQKALPRNQREQSAALHIQRKFRGWKNRKDYLTLRKHVVKIQAHVRGHQARKKFKNLLRTVSVIEKAVLRWRRKRVGLRGFQGESSVNGVNSDDDDFFREGRKHKEMAMEKAVARVRSMARHEDARQQYGRMVEGSRLAQEAFERGNDQLMEDSK